MKTPAFAIDSNARRDLSVDRAQSVPLALGDMLTVKRARRLTVRCEVGQLWITDLDRVADIVLEAGESITLSPVRHAIVRAAARSVVAVDTEARGLRRISASPWARWLGLEPTSIQVRSPIATMR